MASMTEQELKQSLKAWDQRAKKEKVTFLQARGTLQRAQAAAAKRRHQLKALHPNLQKVVHWELAKVGTHEIGSSNTGPLINKWQADAGMHAQPWCALFQMYAIHHILRIDLPNDCAFTPNFVHYARKDQYHLAEVSIHESRAGDLWFFKFPGESNYICDHVGMYIGKGQTVEGNTSPSSGGSQSNGGGVYIHRRPTSLVSAVVRIHI